jgi:ribosomal protein S19
LIITESLVQRELLVHNGKFASLIDIQTSMIGHKLGEFAVTKVLGSEAALRKKAKLLKKKKKKK